MLLIQADRGLGAVVVLVKQTKKLPVIFPVPAGIVHVNKPLVLDLARDFIECGENVRGRRAFRPEPFFLRQTQSANAGENLQPGQKEPAHSRDRAEDMVAGNEINRQIGRDQNAERAGFLRKGALVTAEGDAEHHHSEREEKSEKHYG